MQRGEYIFQLQIQRHLVKGSKRRRRASLSRRKSIFKEIKRGDVGSDSEDERDRRKHSPGGKKGVCVCVFSLVISFIFVIVSTFHRIILYKNTICLYNDAGCLNGTGHYNIQLTGISSQYSHVQRILL